VLTASNIQALLTDAEIHLQIKSMSDAIIDLMFKQLNTICRSVITGFQPLTQMYCTLDPASDSCQDAGACKFCFNVFLFSAHN
jgi:hypothetical protein